jgi:dTMP kinase
MFIVFEGIDGSGKTTQAEFLARKLTSLGIPNILTREPSDGLIGQNLRKLETRLAPEEESRLFLEDRLDHVEKVIRPGIRNHEHVICDRYYHSSAAYQGSRGLNPIDVLRENRLRVPAPDIVFLIDISVSTALSRIGKCRPGGFSIFEKAADLEKVAAIYNTFNDPYIRRINGEKPLPELRLEILGHLKNEGLKICCV